MRVSNSVLYSCDLHKLLALSKTNCAWTIKISTAGTHGTRTVESKNSGQTQRKELSSVII